MGAVYSAQRVSGAPVYGVLFDDGPPPSYTATMAALAVATGYAGFAATYAAPGGGAGSHTATMAALAAATAYAGFAATYAAPGSITTPPRGTVRLPYRVQTIGGFIIARD